MSYLFSYVCYCSAMHMLDVSVKSYECDMSELNRTMANTCRRTSVLQAQRATWLRLRSSTGSCASTATLCPDIWTPPLMVDYCSR